MVHILYYSEINLQLRAKMTHSSQIGKYAPDERIRGIFVSAESLPTSATLLQTYWISQFKPTWLSPFINIYYGYVIQCMYAKVYSFVLGHFERYELA